MIGYVTNQFTFWAWVYSFLKWSNTLTGWPWETCAQSGRWHGWGPGLKVLASSDVLAFFDFTMYTDFFFFLFKGQFLARVVFLFIYFYIYFWLCWVFVSVRGLPLVAAKGGHSSSRCAGLSLSRPLLLRSTGSRRAGSVVVAHGPSCSAACGIFPDQGSNPCALHWQADSQTLRHQGSPTYVFFSVCCFKN